MEQHQFDFTYNDFNPTILYASKMRVSKPGSYAYHAHDDFTELTIILSGQTLYHIEGVDYPVEAGDIIICNPGVHHQNRIDPNAEPSVQFFTGCSNFHFRNLPPNSLPLRNDSCLLRLTADSKREVQRLCYEMVAENEAGRPGKYFMLKSYLMQMLLIIVREATDIQDVKQKGMNFETYGKGYAVKKIINYMNENYEHKISLDQIAHNMYLSPVYVSKIFKEETGESPINYLIKIRLDKAKGILEQEEGGSIKNIANEVGYEDVYHFSKLFKKYFGVSPLNYRKRFTSSVKE